MLHIEVFDTADILGRNTTTFLKNRIAGLKREQIVGMTTAATAGQDLHHYVTLVWDDTVPTKEKAPKP
jgi:hypothetical protein